MSPTSYQLLHPAMSTCRLRKQDSKYTPSSISPNAFRASPAGRTFAAQLRCILHDYEKRNAPPRWVCEHHWPNVGKSTLMNQLVGERLSIINKKAQTTRHRIMGLVNRTGKSFTAIRPAFDPPTSCGRA